MASQLIRVRPAANCPLCGTAGKPLYTGLKDFSYAAPGEWNFSRCPEKNCGMVWLDPAPVPDDLGLAYQGYYTHHQPEPGASLLRDLVWGVWMGYLIRRFGYPAKLVKPWQRLLAPLALLHPGGRAELEAAAMHLPVPTGPARVVDVGCGSGVLLARMKRLGWEVEGTDVDAGGVAATRSRGIRCLEGELVAQHFPENHFDAVHSAHVLEHVPDPQALLRECLRILKPGGTFVCLTPNVAGWGQNYFGQSWLCLDPPRHLNLFTQPALRRAVEQAGFQITRLETTIRTAWVYGALSYCIRKTGRAEMSELNRPLNLLKGVGYQLRQRAALCADANAGDELLIIGTKT
jgi:2-polyprenyl-3-methyl-5-hydroxy-6-metoxy-1,4-benzoquinol methylase